MSITAPGGQQAEAARTVFDELLDADAKPVSAYLRDRATVDFDDYEVDAAEYTSAEFAAREAERLWPKVWQLAGRENDLPQAGDYLEYRILDWSVLLVRGDDGAVRAFRNACRHRGTAVASDQGNAACFSCPFHGWTFDLEGHLVDVPAEWDFPGLDRGDYGLITVRVDTFDGWIFINLDDDAAPLVDFLGPVLTEHLQAVPDERMWKAWHYVRTVECNWKVLAEAFFEAYHLARTHPQMIAYTGDTQSAYDSYGLHARVCTPVSVPSILGGGQYSEQEILDETLALMGARTGGAFDGLTVPDGATARSVMAEMVRQQAGAFGMDLGDVSDAELQDGILYFVFPNMKPFRGVAGHIVYRFRPNGHDPNSCLFDVMNLLPIPGDGPLPPDTPAHVMAPGEKFADHEPMGIIGSVLDQDCSNAPLIQRGLHNLKAIRLAQRQEQNIVAFHRNLASWLEQ